MRKEILEAEGLLRIGILQNGDFGPADISLTQGIIVLRGQDILGVWSSFKKDVMKMKPVETFQIAVYYKTVGKAEGKQMYQKILEF